MCHRVNYCTSLFVLHTLMKFEPNPLTFPITQKPYSSLDCSQNCLFFDWKRPKVQLTLVCWLWVLTTPVIQFEVFWVLYTRILCPERLTQPVVRSSRLRCCSSHSPSSLSIMGCWASVDRASDNCGELTIPYN